MSTVADAPDEKLDVVGIGSMVLDRVHLVPRLLAADQKGTMRARGDGASVRHHVGGVVLNHLGWAAALGLRVGIFGRQADDDAGRFLRAAMDAAGIERDISLEAADSSFAEIFVDDAGERAIYLAPAATSETTAAHVRSHAAFIERGATLTTEVSQLPLAAAAEALAIARAAGLVTVVDFDVPPSAAFESGLGDADALDAVLRAAWLLKPAKSAAAEVVPEASGDALEMARAMRARYGNAAVVVTDGAAGCAVSADDFEGVVRAQPVKAVDTTGAGDAFLGGLLVGRRHGFGWQDAARLGNACGAACAEQVGAFPEDAEAARARVFELYDGPAFPISERGIAPERDSSAGEALAALDVAIEELTRLRGRLGTEPFDAALALLRRTRESGGRVHVTGVGKPEHVAHYVASLLSSTGTAATFLHGTEAVHGSAGQIVEGDLLIAISNSGETEELRAAARAARHRGASLLGVTGYADSWLAKEADVYLDAGVAREGGPLGLAPRASVAAELLVLAALSAALEHEVGLTKDAYHQRHPSGALGRLSARED
jgi:arabinose-5-phosphate isomerase